MPRGFQALWQIRCDGVVDRMKCHRCGVTFELDEESLNFFVNEDDEIEIVVECPECGHTHRAMVDPEEDFE